MAQHHVLQNTILNRSKDLKFTDDNVVRYLRREMVDGATTYNPCKPDIFWKGQLVEAQVTFVGILEKDGKHTFRCRLSALVWMGYGCALDILEHTLKETETVVSATAVTHKRVIPYGDGPDVKRFRTKLSGVDIYGTNSGN
ncbi:hypothetical protein M422DRAFT_271829 [Sphaerobolus stellatus SS14]|uniref:Uncharacterized protein n=1 Tax=Sphaerobolus stellatus (strain SS14) TaxID=990650 RepID=A0A0C9UNG1_SPHS4|nr:hypothetical protein M422DRAFT_271829 [Sphaerobolus stellatus SS14]